MDKDSILPKYFGNPDNLHHLTDNRYLTYIYSVVAKNGKQNWRSENKKVHSHLLRGFFYARNLVHCATMTGCVVRESLVSALDSLLSFLSRTPTLLHKSVTFQLALEVTVSKFKKETVKCL